MEDNTRIPFYTVSMSNGEKSVQSLTKDELLVWLKENMPEEVAIREIVIHGTDFIPLKFRHK
jgi:hypothetical protein